MKILLVYFTGTYNTLYITTLIKNRLIKKGHAVDQVCISNNCNIQSNGYDMVGIGYPIHAFNAPLIVENTIEKANIKNKQYFIYKVSGEPFNYNKASSYKLTRILKKGNNKLLGEYHFVMPYNILFRTRDDIVVHELNMANKLSKYMCDTIEEVKPYRVNIFNRFVTWLFKIQRLGIKLNIKKYVVDEEKCIRCHKCIDLCPNKNIVFNKELKKIEFKNDCTMCMRCSFVCPTDAIKIGLLNKIKVNGQYCFNDYMDKEDNYDISKEKANFYKRFKKYFNYIEKLENK